MKKRKNWGRANRPTVEKAQLNWNKYKVGVVMANHPEIPESAKDDLLAFMLLQPWNSYSLDGFKQAATDSGSLDSVKVVGV